MISDQVSVQPLRILGLGAVSPYGWGVSHLWEGLESRETAARLYHGLGGAFPEACWFARVQDQPAAGVGSTRYQRAISFAIDEAIDDACQRGWTPGPRVGVVHATTRGDLELMRARYLAPGSVPLRRAYVEQAWTTPPALAMIRHRFTGPALIASAACSSGLHALATAQRLITCGDASDMIVVASDVGFDGEEMTMFAALSPLIYDAPSHEICRPFHEGSRGFVLGEGAAALVLSGSDSVAEPYVELLATAIGTDAFHPVAIEPSHVHIVDTVNRSLAAAGVQTSEIGAFCGHGTGTLECQEADLAVLAHLGPQAAGCGLKPLLGHSMAASSLFDAVALARARTEGALPVHGQLEGALAADPHRESLLALASDHQPHGVRDGHGLCHDDPDRDDQWRAGDPHPLPLTSSHADPESGGTDLLALDKGPYLQLSLGFGGNICAATYAGWPN
jgi:3-oxoacyl-[acyl-carrier-protein] synthase II